MRYLGLVENAFQISDAVRLGETKCKKQSVIIITQWVINPYAINDKKAFKTTDIQIFKCLSASFI